MAERLKDKVAIVTGAGSRGPGVGNGKAAAILFAREGASVLCVDLVAERAQETVDLITADGGVASAFAADVSRQVECRAMVDAAVERYGRLHILHNNVGIGSGQGLAEVTEVEWDQVMAVNVRSAVLASQAAAERMEDGGSIISIASIAAYRAYPPAYTTSKMAVVGLTTSLAGELGHRRIRANCIAPGQVYTPMVVDSLSPETRQARAEGGVIKEEGNAWDIGWAAVFLASDESRWVTGQTLLVDAGISVRMPNYP